jgi:hypothetical protein
MAAAVDHMGQPRADGPPHPEQIDLDHPLVGIGIDHPHRRRGRSDARVGHHDVEPAEPSDGLRHGRLDRGGVGDVGRRRQRAIAADLRRGRLYRFHVEVNEHHR